MNMDELVKNIVNAEETQEGLQRQGSISLPRILSQRSVDEVWKCITEEEHTNDHGGGGGGGGGGGTHIPQIQRQQALGDITLEDLLIRAGARGNNNTNGGYFHDSSSLITGNPNTSMVPRTHDSNMHQNVNGSVSTYQPQQPIIFYANGTQIGSSTGFMGVGDQSLQANKGSLVPSVTTIPSGAMTCSSNTPFPISDGIQKTNGDSSYGSIGMRGRTNNTGITVETKVIEQRQRRKIKNRESAARSRARKQAEIMETELELENLKKEYQELLRKQTEMSNMQTKPEMINRPERPPLRRTKSDIN